MDEHTSRVLSLWLFMSAALVLLLTVVWGISRLTEIGLSLTYQKPPTTMAFPKNPADWHRDYTFYIRSPAFTKQRSPEGFALADFWYLRFWGWAQQQLCWWSAAVYTLPWIYFSSTDRIPPELQPRLFLTFGLSVFQAFMNQSMLPGWLVTKGIEGESPETRLHTSHYQYTFDLMTLMALFLTMMWTGITLRWAQQPTMPQVLASRLRTLALTLLVTAICTLATGGLTAGPDAGLVFNDWPDLEGWLPPLQELLLLVPGLRNTLDGNAAMRGHHRLFVYTTLGLLILLSRLAPAHTLPEPQAGALRLAQRATVLQCALGVGIVFYAPLIPLMALHQGGGLLLLGTYLWLLFTLRAPPAPVRAQ